MDTATPSRLVPQELWHASRGVCRQLAAAWVSDDEPESQGCPLARDGLVKMQAAPRTITVQARNVSCHRHAARPAGDRTDQRYCRSKLQSCRPQDCHSQPSQSSKQRHAASAPGQRQCPQHGLASHECTVCMRIVENVHARWKKFGANEKQCNRKRRERGREVGRDRWIERGRGREWTWYALGRAASSQWDQAASCSMH